MGASIYMLFLFLALTESKGRERKDDKWKDLTKPGVGDPHVFCYFLHFFTVQLILEQHRLELRQSTYTWLLVFFF